MYLDSGCRGHGEFAANSDQGEYFHWPQWRRDQVYMRDMRQSWETCLGLIHYADSMLKQTGPSAYCSTAWIMLRCPSQNVSFLLPHSGGEL